MAIRKVIGIRGINYYTYPKMGSNNLMFGVTKSSGPKKSPKKKKGK